MGQKHPCCISEVATGGGEGGEREEGSGKVVEGIDDTIVAEQVVATLTVTDPSPVGAEGGEKGEDESTKWVELSARPVNWTPVSNNWESVSSLDQNYQTTIKKRMPALFPAYNVVSTHLRITAPPPSQVGVGGALHKYCNNSVSQRITGPGPETQVGVYI